MLKAATAAHRRRRRPVSLSRRPTTSRRRFEGRTPSPSSSRSIGEPPPPCAWRAASGRRSAGSGGAEDGPSRACRDEFDDSREGDDVCPRKRALRPLWWSWLLCARCLIFGVACAAVGDGRSRLAAGQAAAASGSGARWTLLETEMSIAAGIAPGGGPGGRRRRSARSLICPIFRQPCCRPIGRSQSTPPSPHRSIFGAFDAPRAADAERAADRP